ncbi:hypothetical protein [Spirillospora sp. CA-128828]|uniref:hypothetical protein n=1 Tax=Spirillospora sp. CA-128828 TaxID=3240033 RepID=UPI003D912A78
MTKFGATNADQTIDEAVAYTRNVLAWGNPVNDTDLSDAAHDERGRADFYRILNSQEPSKSRSRRRRWTVVAATTLILAGFGATADATGIVPTGVIKSLRAGGDSNLRPLPDKAELRSQTRSPDGDVVQYWEAPNNTKGICSYIRVIAHHGKEETDGGGVSCAMPDNTPGVQKTAWDRVAHIEWEPAFGDRMAAYGHIQPGLKTVTLQVTLTDGRRLAVPVQRDGYFLTILPADVETQKIPADVQAHGQPAISAWLRTHPGVRVQTVAALDANGKTLVTDHEDISAP